MQFSSIIAAFTFALAASATPTPADLIARTSGPVQSNSCPVDQQVVCCKQGSALLNLINLQLQCVVVEIIKVGGTCSNNAQAACCNSGPQNGLVNLGSTCPNVKLI